MNTTASIITGAGRGIGKAIAMRLADTTNVILTGKTEANLETACHEINSKRMGKAEYVVGDVKSMQSALEAVEKVNKNSWSLRNIVCNAGMGKSGALHEFDAKVWHDILDVNVLGAFNFAKAGIPSLLEQGAGNICLVSSVLGLHGAPYDSAYVASKHALVGLAKSMALEYGKRGIQVAALCPSYVEGEMTERTIRSVMVRKGISYDDARARIASKTPNGRIVPVEEIAETVHRFCEGQLVTNKNEALIASGELENGFSETTPSLSELLQWLRDTASKAHGLIVPISGGTDSALCFYLCATAYPEKTIGVFAGDPFALRERAWFEKTGRIQYIPVLGEYEDRESMRWAQFNSLCIRNNAWLVGSRNKTEDRLGTYSLASRVATIQPILGVWKSKVLEFCQQIGVPPAVIASSLEADPGCGRPAELAAIPFERIEYFLREKNGIQQNRPELVLTPAENAYLNGMYEYNRFKRDLPLRP